MWYNMFDVNEFCFILDVFRWTLKYDFNSGYTASFDGLNRFIFIFNITCIRHNMTACKKFNPLHFVQINCIFFIIKTHHFLSKNVENKTENHLIFTYSILVKHTLGQLTLFYKNNKPIYSKHIMDGPWFYLLC